MDGIINFFAQMILRSGCNEKWLHFRKSLELPGFFRPTKEWDLVVVKDDILLVAMETKSQVGPSFGNNFNNRTEEAMGSALDLWTAFREGAFNKGIQPFVGYFFLLEDCPASQSPVKVSEPHFKVFPEFKSASYARRYELFCRKLVRERHYSAASFITSTYQDGLKGRYKEPADDLTLDLFNRALVAHICAYAK